MKGCLRQAPLLRRPLPSKADGVLGELHHLLSHHAPRRLELPPLAVLELHEARHEGAAGEAVGPVQPPDPGAQHVPQKLLHVHAEEGRELLAMSAVCGPYSPFPAGGAQSKWSRSSGGKS